MRLDTTSLRLFVRVVETSIAEAVFIYHPPLLGIIALTASTIGYFRRPCSWLERGLLLACPLMLISGQAITDVVGIALIGGLFAWQSLKHRRAAGTPAC